IKLLTSCALKAIPESALHHHQAAAPNVRVRESRGRAGESSRFSSSQNWCGYAVETDFGSPQNYAVSSVVGQWTIPDLTASTSVLSVTNFTQGVYYRVPTHYTKSRNARRSSAEWIVEAPYSGGILPLAHFDTVNLAGCSATLNNHPGAISDSAWQYDSITME